jgi:glyoxylase-like metal-dependent hydrolase (beta-lactamase superfamily II)
MRVHHLNTGTMCPIGAKFVNGHGGLFERARLVCHVLLAESNDGLVLIDTGLGLSDIANPSQLGRGWVRLTSPRFDAAETAIEQVKKLGFAAHDVRHIVLTHLDRDHAGGLSDFPKAKVHVHLREHEAAVTQKIKSRKGRYIAGQWQHGPNWRLHGGDGEDWYGFRGVRALENRETDILLIPLHGHTPGHCGVAVRGDGKWLLLAGDSYFFHGQIETPPVPAPVALRIFQRIVDTDRAIRIAKQERVRKLKAEHGGEIDIFNSHDPVDYTPYSDVDGHIPGLASPTSVYRVHR